MDEAGVGETGVDEQRITCPLIPQQQKQAVSPAEAEHHVRKSLSRQHAKDIMEYTQQIHAKNKEIEALKKRIAKVRECVCVGGRREG